MEQYASVQQLLKKEEGRDEKLPIYPPTVIQAVHDAKTGAPLESILAQYNSVYIQYQGNPKDTRNIIPQAMRRAGLTITYMNMNSETITERANSSAQMDNDHWGLDTNWSRIDELSLSGDISVSVNGTWIINGEDTGIKAVGPKGDSGITPWLKTIDNKLHYSYDNITWEPCSDPIAHYFRMEENKLQISSDKSNWETVSDYIAAYFRFNPTSGNSQASTVGKIQISRDNKTWTDLSPEFTNNLHIAGYVATTSALPANKPVGTIYGVGPTYAEEDTNQTNPIYRLYVYNGTQWIDNGKFTSIAAGIVQETGDSETEVMSQKATTEKLTELASEVNDIGSLLSVLKIGKGGINSDNGENLEGSTRCRTDNFLYAPFEVSLQQGFESMIFKYDLKGVYIENGDWMDSILTADSNYKYRLIFRKTDNTDISPEEVEFKGYKGRFEFLQHIMDDELKQLDSELKQLGSEVNDIGSLLSVLKIGEGGINSANGENSGGSTRCRTDNYLYAPFEVSLQQGFESMIFKYDLKGVYIEKGDWMDSILIADSNYKYRLIFRKTDNTDISPEEVEFKGYKGRFEFLQHIMDDELKQLGSEVNDIGLDVGLINSTILLSDSITPQIITGLYNNENTITVGSSTFEIHYYIAVKDEKVGIECEVSTLTPTGCIFIVDDVAKIREGYVIENLIQPNMEKGGIVLRTISLKKGQVVALSTYRDQKDSFIIYTGKDKLNEIEKKINALELKKIKAEDIEDNAVTLKKVSFAVTSENVVDWQNIDIRDWTLSSAVESSSYKATDFIRLEANTTYSCNMTLRRVYTFERLGKFEDKVNATSNPAIQSIEEVTQFTTGDTDVYVRLMVRNTIFNVGTIMLVKGVELPDEYVPYQIMIDPNVLPNKKSEKKLTAVGSSGIARNSGGQWALTEEQKSKYGVSTDLTMTRVLQVLLGYDKSNIIAVGGNTASNSMFMCGLSNYILLNSFVLKADKSNTEYIWTTGSIAASMTENLNTLGNVKGNGAFNAVINGISVYVVPDTGTIRPIEDLYADITIPANSSLIREPRTVSELNGSVMEKIQGSYGLVLQIGANDEGATPEELINYFELAIKESGCSWFICLPKNGAGIHTTSELNNAIPLLKKKFGSRFIDHRPYMCSLKALKDQDITPTTSDEYPDIYGVNSHPMTPTQMANNIPCDMQCIAEGRYPSSFWHSAYREDEPTNQTMNATHFNAQGLECLGKYLYKMIKLMKLDFSPK